MRRYYGIVHVRWELPFPSRLPPLAFACWEPVEGVALMNCLPRVGTVKWRRHSTIVSAQELLGDRYIEEPTWALPNYDYRESSLTSDQREIFTTELLAGAEGGFDEAHAYTVAHVFLCMRAKADTLNEAVISRAAAAINNVFGIHALLAADGWTRPMRPDLDSYCTLCSLAQIPESWAQMTAADALRRVSELTFPTEIGKGRTPMVGLGSHDDLLQGEFSSEHLSLLRSLCQRQLELAPYQQLLLSAIRRLGRREFASAIIDAQSAGELCVSGILRQLLLAEGESEEDVEIGFSKRGVGHHIDRLDRYEKARGTENPFGVSTHRDAWKLKLEKLRHAIVHRGLRELTFDQTRLGIAAGMSAIARLEEIWPQYQPPVRWTGDYVKAQHLTKSAGKLYRLFDT